MGRVIFCTEFVLLTVLLVRVKASTITVNKDHCGGYNNLDESESLFLNYYGAHFKRCDSVKYLSNDKNCTFKISASRSNNEICIKLKNKERGSFYKQEKCNDFFKYYIGSYGHFAETSYSCIDFDADPLCTTRDTVYAVFRLYNTSFVSCEDVSMELEIYTRKTSPQREKQMGSRRSRTPRFNTGYFDTYDWTDDTDLASLLLFDYYDALISDYYDNSDYEMITYSYLEPSYDTSDTSFDTSDTSFDTSDTSFDISDTSFDISDTSYDISDTSYDISDTSYDIFDTSYDSDWTSWSNSDNSDYTSWSDSDTLDYLVEKTSTPLPIIFGLLGVFGAFVLLVLTWICCIKDSGGLPSLSRNVQAAGPAILPNDQVSNEPRGHNQVASEDPSGDPWKPPDYNSVILVDQSFYDVRTNEHNSEALGQRDNQLRNVQADGQSTRIMNRYRTVGPPAEASEDPCKPPAYESVVLLDQSFYGDSKPCKVYVCKETGPDNTEDQEDPPPPYPVVNV